MVASRSSSSVTVTTFWAHPVPVSAKPRTSAPSLNVVFMETPPSTPRKKQSPYQLASAVFQDLDEGAPSQLLEREARSQHLLLRDRPARDAAQEKVQEALPGGGVVEDVPHERGLRG